jgi:cytidylate kinase
MSNSIQKLAEMGNCVIVGRGANLITHKLGNGFHVRIIGTKPKRILHLQEYYGMEKKQAEEYIQSEDKARREFVKKIYGADPDDSHLYDIIINTDNISYNDAAEIIGSRVIALKKKLLIKFRR